MSDKLYGIDTFHGEGKDILKKVPYDFAIVKMSGNPQRYAWNYTNPSAATQAGDCMKKTGLLGFYHFTWGKENPNIEADFFIRNVKELGYLGKAMLCIDYEAEATKRGRNWVKKFAERIEEIAGYKPIIYASSSVIREQNLGGLGYPIWCANYYKGYTRINGYNTKGCVIGYKDALIWQFTSSGRLEGSNSDLDLNVFYGSKDDFKKYMGATKKEPPKKDTAKKKSVTTIAKEVIAGKWGNAETRRTRLKVAGYDYDKVQAKVNELLKPKKKTITEVAKEVIDGKWGNGKTRKTKLEKAGYDYSKVQKKVNELLR